MFWHFGGPKSCLGLFVLNHYRCVCVCWKLAFLLPKDFQVTTLDTLWRHLLIKLGFWGQQQEPIRIHLHRAYLQFKAWCSLKKISCSQPCFQEKLVPSRNLAHCSVLVFHFLIFQLLNKRTLACTSVEMFWTIHHSHKQLSCTWRRERSCSCAKPTMAE